MQQSGYSGTSLAKKLGIKPGDSLRLIDEPPYYFDLFPDLPEGIRSIKNGRDPVQIIHIFSKELAKLRRDIPVLRAQIVPEGMIWVSWPKKSSRVVTDISENHIREIATGNSLVDVKVCAIDEIWSGLKLVIPLKDRPVAGGARY